MTRLVLAKQTELISNNDGIGTPHDDQLDNTKSIQASNMHNNMTESSPMPISLNRHINKPKNNVVNVSFYQSSLHFFDKKFCYFVYRVYHRN